MFFCECIFVVVVILVGVGVFVNVIGEVICIDMFDLVFEDGWY